ncbi:MAG: bifunctional UDP-sugar hydrolase/5'-nucleotidase [Myxococcota bacterium]
MRYLLALALLAACTVRRDQPDLDGQQVAITFLHTSDWHSRLLPYDMVVGETDERLGLYQKDAPFGGAARAATIIRRERARGGRVLHLDSGDSFQGAPIFNVFDGEVEFRALSQVGLDAAVIGNHEFDRGGPNFIDKAQRFAAFPLLAANYLLAPTGAASPTGVAPLADVTLPYAVLDAGGLRVGVIGVGNTSSLSSLFQRGNALGITPLEIVQVVQDYVDFVRPLSDLVVLVTHIGPNEDQWVVEHTEGIDAVFGGHLHIVINPPRVAMDCQPGSEIAARRGCTPRRVPIVHSGAFLKYVGRLDVVAMQQPPGSSNWEIVAHAYQALPVSCQGDGGEDCALPEDPAMLALLEPYASQLHQMTNLVRVVGYAPAKIARFATGSGDSALGDLVAESMLAQQSVIADFSITNTLGIRADLDPGPITVEHLFNVFPFDNTITVLLMSGVETLELFDFVANRSAGRGCAAQSQISGATFVMDCNFGTPCPDREEGVLTPCARDVTVGGSGQPCDADEDCEAGEICTRRDHPVEAEARVCGLPITPLAAYQLAANDYIARGGSGFDVLRRNTSQQNLGISLRDAVVDYLNLRPTCGEGVNPALGDMLYELGRRATDGESVDVGALVRGVGDAHEDYIACADPDGEIGLAAFARRECRGLDGGERSQCEELAAVRSALVCLVLPCIHASADGRIERVFLGTTEPSGEQQENENIE